MGVRTFDHRQGRVIDPATGLVHAEALLLPGAGWVFGYDVVVYADFPDWRHRRIGVDMGAREGVWAGESKRRQAFDDALAALGAVRRSDWINGNPTWEALVELREKEER